MTKKAEVIREIEEGLDRIMGHYQEVSFEKKEVYGQWLAQTYYYVSQVTRVLSFAAGKCELPKQKDLHFKLIRSLNEESHHDQMALDDLTHLGLELSDFSEHLATRNFLQVLIYMIETYGPYALVGYFFPQEGIASKKLRPLYEQLEQRYGKSTVVFLKEHVILDVEHYGEAIASLDHLSDQELEIVRLGAERSTELYCEIIKSVGRYETQIRTGQLKQSLAVEGLFL